MILYFSGTGNSLAIARKIAEATNDQVLPLTEAAQQNLTNEQRIGLVFPTYDFNMPPAVRTLVPRLKISPNAYVFAITTCGAQAGNSLWTLRRLLRLKGIELAYAHKIRVPDNSAIAFGRNPNEQAWKFEKFASRLEQIKDDVKAQRHERHFAWWSLAGGIMGWSFLENGMLRTFHPVVDEAKCTGCKTCARVCPMENISLCSVSPQDGLYSVSSKSGLVTHIGDNCTICLACVHVCPQQAISVNGREALKERQYRHPDIKLKDLIKR